MHSHKVLLRCSTNMLCIQRAMSKHKEPIYTMNTKQSLTRYQLVTLHNVSSNTQSKNPLLLRTRSSSNVIYWAVRNTKAKRLNCYWSRDTAAEHFLVCHILFLLSTCLQSFMFHVNALNAANLASSLNLSVNKASAIDLLPARVS